MFNNSLLFFDIKRLYIHTFIVDLLSQNMLFNCIFLMKICKLFRVTHSKHIYWASAGLKTDVYLKRPTISLLTYNITLFIWRYLMEEIMQLIRNTYCFSIRFMYHQYDSD